MTDKQVFVIVPVKPLEQGKSRLSPLLDAKERRRLNVFFMRRTFDLLAAFPGSSRSIVVSSDTGVRDEAQSRGITFVEDEDHDLNRALARATRSAIAKGAEAIIVLPVDLPLATSTDLRRIVPAEGSTKICVIAHDQHRAGTNLLYLEPPSEEIYRFGPDSFDRHRELAAASGYQIVEIHDPVLSLDVDEPSDYKRWLTSPAPVSNNGSET